MATYKVLQDIEAEDKFVGPLTLKQFILACVTVVTGFLIFYFLQHHLLVLIIPLVPILLVSGFLAFPWGRDQPTEVWLLAKLRFMLKPRLRIWDQTGMQELVTITAPKHLAEQYTSDNLSQTEVRSRLKALANTIDSRGWAVKNVNVNLYADPSYAANDQQSDRLVSASTLAGSMPTIDITASDDMMDERNNPTAQHLDQMISQAEQAHRQDTMQHLQDVREHKKPSRHAAHGKANTGDAPPPDFWFMHETAKPKDLPKDYSTFGSTTVHPGDADDGIPDVPASSTLTADEQKLLDEAHKRETEEEIPSYGHTKVIEPLNSKRKSHTKHSTAHTAGKTAKGKSKTSKPPAPHANAKAMTQTPDPAILNLANNDDLSVATIARQANKKQGPEPEDGEVVISWR